MPPAISKRCPTCKRKLRRSNEANRRLWAIYHALAERPVRGKHFSADTWHLWAKTKFLGCEDHKLPSGQVLLIPRSTAELTVGEFNDYMTLLEVWANERGVYVEDHEELTA